MSPWTVEDSKNLYNLDYWSGGYFSIDDQGHLCLQQHDQRFDLIQIVKQAKQQGLGLPVLLRFTDVLQQRLSTLEGAFQQAKQQFDYAGAYQCIYPIKVNQQSSVVQSILAHGPNVGLEAGSKPELMAVMAYSRPNGTIVCNGYKDREYIRLALMGIKLGLRIFLVIEKLSELQMVLSESQKMNVQPLLGIRMRLASIGAGNWQNTGGEKGKFGLTAGQVLQAYEQLKAHDLLPSWQLIHVHLGSQIPNINDIKNGIREVARFYAELRALEVDIKYIDVGGGLGIDYEGTRSRSFCSVNYTVQEYANSVVQLLSDICLEHDLPHPAIFTESGRAITAHHAVLVTNVINREAPGSMEAVSKPWDDEPTVLLDLWQIVENFKQMSLIEVYHNACHLMKEAQDAYVHGVLNLQQRAMAEHYYFEICRRVWSHLNSSVKSHRVILDELNEKLAEKYFCNFSLFQSIPDAWAIRQIFPVLPLQRLNEKPQCRAVVEDLTCDSDGCIKLYVDYDGVDHTLPLHTLKEDEEYLIGLFLVGAYQEILGDMHNLFGDTDSIDVSVQDGKIVVNNPLHGDTVDEVLRYVHMEPQLLLESLTEKVKAAQLDELQTAIYINAFEAGLSGYTYFEDE